MGRLTRLALAAPWTTVVLCIGLATLPALWFLPVEPSVGYSNYLETSHPARSQFNDFLGKFGSGYTITVLWSCAPKCASIDEDLGEAIASHSEIGRVDRRSDEILLRPNEGWLAVQLRDLGSPATLSAVRHLAEVTRPYEASGYTFAFAGDPITAVHAGKAIQDEIPSLVLLIALLLSGGLWLLLRSLVCVIAGLSTTALALLVSTAGHGWLGWPATELSLASIPAVLVIGIAYVVHVLSRVSTEEPARRTGEQLARIADRIGPACTISAATTIGAFLSLHLAGSTAFLRFGVLTALGTLAAYVLSFSFLPALLVILRRHAPSPPVPNDRWSRALEYVGQTAFARSAPFLIGISVLGCIAALGLLDLKMDVDLKKLLGDEANVVVWEEAIARSVGPTDGLELVVTGPERIDIESRDARETLRRLHQGIESIAGLGPVRSIRDRDWRPGISEESVVADPAHWMTADGRHLRLAIAHLPMSNRDRVNTLALVDSVLDRELPDDWSAVLTGPFVAFEAATSRVQATQVRSFGTTAIAVFAIFGALLLWTTPWRNALQLSGLAVLATFVPLVLTLGFMGWWGLNLDGVTAVAVAVALGTGIDDSIHLILAFRDARQRGRNSRQAVVAAIHAVGRPIIYTSIALALGFFALVSSAFLSIESFGILAGAGVLAALVFDLFVLPVLLIAVTHAKNVEELVATERLATVGQVAAGVAHDVTKPLSVAYQRARAMANNPESPVAQRQQAESLALLTDEALSEVQRLLELSAPNDSEPTRQGTVREIASRARHVVEEIHGADRVTVRLDSDLPSLPAPRDLTRVLINLLDNALRASEKGQSVDLHAHRTKGGVGFDVIDHGNGMPGSDVERAGREPFSTRSDGHGIGLYSSHAIVRQLGGNTEIHTEPGRGTTVRFEVPTAPL